MADPLVVQREVQIAAPRATVFAFLTHPERILSWLWTRGRNRAASRRPLSRQGRGRLPRPCRRGAFCGEVVPVHRLAYSFGWKSAK